MLKNQRHERFAQGIAKGLTAKDAYIQAGYKARDNAAEVNAARLLRNAQVRARIEQLAVEIKNQAVADAEEIQRFFTVVMRGEVTEQLLTRSGDLVTAPANVRDRTKAAELLARARGVFSNTDAAADGELAAIAEALREAEAPSLAN